MHLDEHPVLLLTEVPMNPKTSKDRMTLFMFRFSPFRHVCRIQSVCRRICLAALLASSWTLVVVFAHPVCVLTSVG